MKGQFRIRQRGKDDIVIPNLVTSAGQIAFLRQLFQGATLGTNMYMGACNQAPNSATVLADLTTEPDGAGTEPGYARQTLARNSTDWPTISSINGINFIASKFVTFANSGAVDWVQPITRLFLTSAASGTSGTLFCFSGPSPSETIITPTLPLEVRYEFFVN